MADLRALGYDQRASALNEDTPASARTLAAGSTTSGPHKQAHALHKDVLAFISYSPPRATSYSSSPDEDSGERKLSGRCR
jgi:hypothetical protein